jgi:peptidoglycan/xylan/chitin deacetylase (PgdA/CDA1 family)
MIAALLGLLILSVVVFSYRYGWWVPTVDYTKPRILMYHMVNEPKPGQKFKGLRVSPLDFERQVRFMAENGWHFMTMTQLMSAAALPEKTVAITFDDGYEDNYTHAFPILKKYQAKATLYLVVDRHDRDWSVNKKAHHDTGELAREPKLSDEQVQEMLASGVFELGAHTLTHVNFQQTNDEQKQKEICDGKLQLEQVFRVPVTSFAYPFGIYRSNDTEMVRAAGFTSSVTTVSGIDYDIHAKPMELSRVKISGKDSFLAFKIRLRIGRRGWKK